MIHVFPLGVLMAALELEAEAEKEASKGDPATQAIVSAAKRAKKAVAKGRAS